MKKLLTLIFFLSICGQVSAQNSVFVRVYDLNGKKISKGHIITTTDTNLQLKRGNDTINILAHDIGRIKTRHSGWHNVLISTSIGVVAGAIVGSINPPTSSSGGTFTWAGSSAGAEFASGVVTGLIPGAAIGGISTLFKNSKTFIVNGDLNKWNNFKTYILKKQQQ